MVSPIVSVVRAKLAFSEFSLGDRASLHCPPHSGATGLWVKRVAMAETTPQKQQASARLLQVGVDEDQLDGSYPEGVSRTPGSPTKHGGRTMWTKADDDEDAMNGASAVGVSGTNGDGESEPVIKQLTHADSLAAPVYGTSAQPTSFKRKGGGVDGRGAGAPAGGGGGGLLEALMCCIPVRKEDRNDEVRLATRDERALDAHREPHPIAIVELSNDPKAGFGDGFSERPRVGHGRN